MQNSNTYSKIEEGMQLDKETKTKSSFNTDMESRVPKHDLETRMWPMVASIGIIEVVFGIILLSVLTIYSNHYTKLYDSKVISLLAFGGLGALAVSGVALLTSLALDNQRIMWFYILSSTSLCFYVFMLSLTKIHFALLIVQEESYKHPAANNQFLLSTVCIVGILTLLGSVIHFIGNLMVLTYYNLRFVHPIMLNCGP